MPARLVRAGLRRLGLHPDDPEATSFVLTGRAVVIATNCGQLDIGKPTGVFASELTAAYYGFLDAGLEVDVASPAGGMIPVDPLSVRAVIRASTDDRFLGDDVLKGKVTSSLAVGDLDAGEYDLVYLAGGWGAAFDFGTSDALGAFVTDAYAAGAVIGGICHGPLGLINAHDTDGSPLVDGRRLTGASDRQIKELRIGGSTPIHPETELRRHGARYESSRRWLDTLANRWVVDGTLVTGQNQNAGPMVAREMLTLLATRGN